MSLVISALIGSKPSGAFVIIGQFQNASDTLSNPPHQSNSSHLALSQMFAPIYQYVASEAAINPFICIITCLNKEIDK